MVTILYTFLYGERIFLCLCEELFYSFLSLDQLPTLLCLALSMKLNWNFMRIFKELLPREVFARSTSSGTSPLSCYHLFLVPSLRVAFTEFLCCTSRGSQKAPGCVFPESAVSSLMRLTPISLLPLSLWGFWGALSSLLANSLFGVFIIVNCHMGSFTGKQTTQLNAWLPTCVWTEQRWALTNWLWKKVMWSAMIMTCSFMMIVIHGLES